MERFKSILLVLAPEAENQSAFGRAVTLAKENEAQLTVVKIVPSCPVETQRFVEVMSVADVHEFVMQAGRDLLEKLIVPVQQGGVQVGTKVLNGTPFLEIIREMLREKHDLVIVTGEGRVGGKKWLFGSTSLHLMRKCPCPVWVVKPTQKGPFTRILVAVDTDPYESNAEHDALNTQIMELATSLAEREQSELHIVHSWTMFGESLFKSAFAHLDEAQIEAMLLQERQLHQRKLDSLLAQSALEKVTHQVHLEKGDADRTIPRVAREQQIDLIVMGTVCRTGTAGILIGNTAEGVLQHVDCSVLTVKPRGFVSPVSLNGARSPLGSSHANSGRSTSCTDTNASW